MTKFNLSNKYWFPYLWILFSFILIMYSVNKFPANPYKPNNSNERKLISKIIAADPIKINSADIKELMKLKGIGQKRAEEIIAYRNKHGKFKNLNQLKRVPGLGTRLLRDNNGLLLID